MIPPLPIELYPADTLEGVIARAMVRAICKCTDHAIDVESIKGIPAEYCALMREAGWPANYQHAFLVRLRGDLTELTRAHPVTRQFIQLLTLELEFN